MAGTARRTYLQVRQPVLTLRPHTRVHFFFGFGASGEVEDIVLAGLWATGGVGK
jgi:hypothetical protein